MSRDPLQATDVFTPGSFPTYTYVERADTSIANDLKDAIETKGHIVSLVGPSKSGKTVLVEKVVGRDRLLVITGAGIGSPEDVWHRFLDAARRPHSTSAERGHKSGASAEVSTEGSASVWGLIASRIGLRGKIESERSKSDGATFSRRGLEEVVDLFANTDVVLLIDDFHYMAREVQADATKSLKEIARRGVNVVVAAVGHRADDIGRANPELRGRVELIEINYWNREELERIAVLGFRALNVGVAPQTTVLLAREAAGSPQLMQLICLNACREVGVRQQSKRHLTLDLNRDRVTDVFRRSAKAADFRSLVEVMEDGPRVRGTDRKRYVAKHGWEGDVYSVVLAALAIDPPKLSFRYDELVERAKELCVDDTPSGAALTACCAQMDKLASKRFPKERVIDWDKQKQILSIADPHFLFYLRWSGKLEDIPIEEET